MYSRSRNGMIPPNYRGNAFELSPAESADDRCDRAPARTPLFPWRLRADDVLIAGLIILILAGGGDEDVIILLAFLLLA